MVVWSKIVPIAALGVGLLFLANAFTRPAAATSTARALTEQISVLGSAGSNIAQLGQGVGGGLAGLFKPIWEISNLLERFSSLSSGSANVSPVSQSITPIPSSNTYTTSGGTDSAQITSTPNTSSGHWGGAGGTITSGTFGSVDTSTGWGV